MDACRFGKVRGKRLHPSIQGTGIAHHATLSEPLRYLGVAQAVAEVPPNGKGNEGIREAVATEG